MWGWPTSSGNEGLYTDSLEYERVAQYSNGSLFVLCWHLPSCEQFPIALITRKMIVSSMGYRGRIGAVQSFLFLMVALGVSGSAQANLVAPPSTGIFGIAFLNLPINGFLLLGLYLMLIDLGKQPVGNSVMDHFILFLSLVISISLIGAMIDVTVLWGVSIWQPIVGAVCIGFTTALLAYRYLQTDLRESLMIAVGFFVVNITSWSLMTIDFIMDVDSQYCVVVWVFIILFLACLLYFSSILMQGKADDAEEKWEVTLHMENMRIAESIAVTFVLMIIFVIYGLIYLPRYL